VRAEKVAKLFEDIKKEKFWKNAEKGADKAAEYPAKLQAFSSEQLQAGGPPALAQANINIADIYGYYANHFQAALDDGDTNAAISGLIMGILGAGDEVDDNWWSGFVQAAVAGEGDLGLAQAIIADTVSTFACV
jgi:hypothetical protein